MKHVRKKGQNGGIVGDHSQMRGTCDQKKTKSSIKALLASSAHGILICIILLGTVSWAWFTQIVDAPSTHIKAASYGISAQIKIDGDVVTSGDCSSVTDGDGLVIEVEKGKVLDVTLTASGNAELYGGYCVVSAGDDLHYTVQIGGEGNPEEITFQMLFQGNGTGKVEFLPYWGTYPSTLPEEWREEIILGEGNDLISQGSGYVVSGGDVKQVTSGDNS